MTHKDQVARLLGALKDSHQKHMDAIGIDLRDSSVGCDVCQFIAQTEAELAAESRCENEEWVELPDAASFDDMNPSKPSRLPTIVGIKRQAKRVIAALNLPEDGGLAFDRGRWRIHMKKAYWHEKAQCWFSGLNEGSLPEGSIPPWPGDWRESWITMSSEEV